MSTLTAPPAPSRRGLLVGGMAGAALLGLAACGSDSSAPAATDSPISVKHRFGTTTLPAPPTRVVSAGTCGQDFLLALGVVPVGITDWYGDQPDATWPWAHDRLGGAQPTVLSAEDGYQFEKIAALKPDLIIATNDAMTEGDYAKLSAIAPTLAQSADHADYYSPWDVQTVAIGTALGRASQAEAVVEEVKKRFADTRAAHPEFDGTAAIFLQNAVYDGRVIAYQEGFSTEFLTDLGFTIPSQIDAFAKDAQAYIPLEQLSVLDNAETLIWATEEDSDEAALHKAAGFDQLAAVKAGRSIYTGGVLSGAIYFSSPLSLPYVLDHLVPQLSDALA
jgi:iron complex transport system substrate-binding protein